MQSSSIVGVIGLGIACGWLIGFFIFKEDSTIPKQLVSVFGGIIGAVAGASEQGWNFWSEILETLGFIISNVMKLFATYKISGIHVIPTILTACIIGALISTAYKLVGSTK